MSESSTYMDRLDALKCAVVIPTYNNGGTVAGVVADVRKYARHVFVIDDGSTDDTAAVLASIPDIEVISCEKNGGKGLALRLGLKTVREAGFDYAVTIDADGQHFADDIPVFIERIEQVPGSLLVGARNITAENMPAKNTFANKFSNFWFRAETGRKMSDTQSGFRLYPLGAIEDMHFFTHRYEFEAEVLVRAAWKGIHVENVPVRVYYPPAGERVSHFRPVRDFLRISLLNTVLVLVALLAYYPWRFVRALTKKNIRRFIDRQIVHSPDSNPRMAGAMGWGIFCGMLPFWGYQMIIAAVSSHLLRLNKVVALVFSNISIPPMIPFILYGSMVCGACVLGMDNPFSLDSISLDQLGHSLKQYIVGSFTLAAASGLLVFLVAWLVMAICKRGKNA